MRPLHVVARMVAGAAIARGQPDAGAGSAPGERIWLEPGAAEHLLTPGLMQVQPDQAQHFLRGVFDRLRVMRCG